MKERPFIILENYCHSLKLHANVIIDAVVEKREENSIDADVAYGVYVRDEASIDADAAYGLYENWLLAGMLSLSNADAFGVGVFTGWSLARVDQPAWILAMESRLQTQMKESWG